MTSPYLRQVVCLPDQVILNSIYLRDGKFYSVVEFEDQSTKELGPFESTSEAYGVVQNLGCPVPLDPLSKWRGKGRFWLIPDNRGKWMLVLMKKDRSATEETGVLFNSKEEAKLTVNDPTMLVHGEPQ